MYLRQRPKSENWAKVWRPVAPQPYVVQKSRLDPGHPMVLGLQRGVNSISLQCIPWLAACCEWGACLTEFDRSSTSRFSGSGIRTIIRIGLKSWSVRPCPDTCRHAKFHPNPCTRFWVILLTDRQTSRAIAYRPIACRRWTIWNDVLDYNVITIDYARTHLATNRISPVFASSLKYLLYNFYFKQQCMRSDGRHQLNSTSHLKVANTKKEAQYELMYILDS